MNNTPVTDNIKTAIVIPFAPTIDQSFAAFLTIPFVVTNKSEIKYYFSRTSKPDFNFRKRVERIADVGKIILIDLGKQKYRGFAPSASQLVVNEFEALQSDRQVQSLVDQINENNRTGFLKNNKYSIAKILRKIYYLDCEMSMSDSEAEAILRRTYKVFRANFLKPKRLWNEINNEENAALKELWRSFGVNNLKVKDFTICKYFVQMFEGGVETKEILSEIDWWMDQQGFIAEEESKAKAVCFAPKTFALKKSAIGISIEVKNQFESEAFINEYMKSNSYTVGLIRSCTGHAFINCNSTKFSVNLNNLYNFLNEAEPYKWHVIKRNNGQMLMNGSPQFPGVKSTKFTSEEIEQYITKYAIIS